MDIYTKEPQRLANTNYFSLATNLKQLYSWASIMKQTLIRLPL